jgi:hypothetical protein
LLTFSYSVRHRPIGTGWQTPEAQEMLFGGPTLEEIAAAEEKQDVAVYGQMPKRFQ